MIPIQYALRRRMMINASKGLPISSLPLGTLIRIADSDGGAGTPNYEIADKDNFVSGGVVLVRKNIHSESAFGSTQYSGSTLDNLIKTTIYNEMPQMLQDIMMDITLIRYPTVVTRKIFALTKAIASNDTLQLYTSDTSRIKTFNGSAAGWWLSSKYDSERAWYVGRDGSIIYTNGWISGKYGVVPAFVIPSETLYSVTPNTDGSYNLIL